MNMKHCYKCGRLISNDTNFCPYCGAKQPQLQPQNNSQMRFSQQSQPVASRTQNVQTVSPFHVPKLSSIPKKAKLIAASLLGALVIGGVCYHEYNEHMPQAINLAKQLPNKKYKLSSHPEIVPYSDGKYAFYNGEFKSTTSDNSDTSDTTGYRAQGQSLIIDKNHTQNSDNIDSSDSHDMTMYFHLVRQSGKGHRLVFKLTKISGQTNNSVPKEASVSTLDRKTQKYVKRYAKTPKEHMKLERYMYKIYNKPLVLTQKGSLSNNS